MEKIWRQRVGAKLETLDWKAAREDVAPFLERREDLAWISKERLLRLLRQND